MEIGDIVSRDRSATWNSEDEIPKRKRYDGNSGGVCDRIF